MRRALLALAAVVALVPGTATAVDRATTVVSDAAFPTNMAFAPDGRLFYDEKDTGDVRIVKDGRLLSQPFAHFDVVSGGETGLLGLAIPPDFVTDPWVYVYYSDATTGMNRIVRIRANGDVGGEVQPVFTALPTRNGYHNGGDIAFGPDGKLYVTVGEIHEQNRAQDPNDIGGKILRLNPDGTVPPDNPFGSDDPVYSMGHRNSFGICFDPTGKLWETENGPDSDDEVNLIRAGGNYGWPDQLGPGGEPRFVDPAIDFPHVIVPTGCSAWHGSLWFGDLSGRLYRYTLTTHPVGGAVATLPSGIIDLEVGPDGSLYAATTDAIVRFDAPPATQTASPTPARVKSNHFETYAAWVAGIVALVVSIVGGLWFRRIARREAARERAARGDGPTPDA